MFWRPDMRVVIAAIVGLAIGYGSTAFAQATKPPEIRVTQRSYRPIVEVPPLTTPSQCGVVNRPKLLRPQGPVYCGVVPSPPHGTPVNQARTLTYEQQIQAAKRSFSGLDLNHDGVISRREWSVAEARAAAPVPQQNRAQFICAMENDFKAIDRNHDGKITYAEFIADNFGKDRQPIRGYC